MPKQSKTYTISLTDADRIIVRQVRNGYNISTFSVQYEALIYSRWHKITRYDSAHGHPHRHVYYPNRKEYKHPMSTADNNHAFTEAQLVIKKNFMSMKSRYILLIDRNTEGSMV
jgi:hypothetical protein